MSCHDSFWPIGHSALIVERHFPSTCYTLLHLKRFFAEHHWVKYHFKLQPTTKQTDLTKWFVIFFGENSQLKSLEMNCKFGVIVGCVKLHTTERKKVKQVFDTFIPFWLYGKFMKHHRHHHRQWMNDMQCLCSKWQSSEWFWRWDTSWTIVNS